MKRIITYDLANKDSNDYSELYEVLDELGREDITESTCWINTSLSQKAIVDKIKKVIDENDLVYFISVDSETKELFVNKICSTRDKY